ncbi:MAG: hypothetical protein KKI08_24205 [Armatimonadetes bacterium]|nr:hypothetical protein [Armatimonadota bacterium]
MAVTDDQRLAVLHDHYKDSFAYVRAYSTQRDRLFVFALAALLATFLEMVAPAASAEAATTVIADKLAEGIRLSPAVLGSGIRFLLLAVAVRYFQAALTVHRQYDTIHSLERTLSDLWGEAVFNREGSSYLGSLPAFSVWARFLYTAVYPALLILVVLVRSIDDVKAVPASPFLATLNLLLSAGIVTSAGLYIWAIHCSRKDTIAPV